MKFKIDENLHADCAARLRSAGHDAMTVFEQGMTGASDDEIANVCTAERRVIVTADLDFSDARKAKQNAAEGLILLRLNDQAKSAQLAAIGRIGEALALNPMTAHIWIVDEHRIRIRALS